MSILLLTACNGSDPARSVGTAKPPATVQETFEKLREWHARGSYGSMRPYLDADSREDVIDLLIAVDELLVVNSALRTRIKEACPTADARRYDMSLIADNLDLFSRRVELVKVEESGSEATIVAEVSGRLPLVRLQFKRAGDAWVYAPGPSRPQIVGSIRGLTRSLGQIALVLKDRKTDPASIDEEYRVRMQPKLAQIKRLSALATRPQNG